MNYDFSVRTHVRTTGLLLFVALFPLTVMGWGDTGHRVVTRIAFRYLNAQAKTTVVDLVKADIALNRNYYQHKCPDVLVLGDKATPSAQELERFAEMGLACVAPWPDPPLKSERLYTSNWHFVDIPVNLQGPNGPVRFAFDVSRDCRMDDQRGDCAILAMKRLRPVLANRREQVVSRAEALKFIVHIIGDLHQPLHSVTDKKDVNNPSDIGDIGGNRKIVQFNVPAWNNNANKNVNPRWHEQWNLHSVWDEGIIDALMNIDNLSEDQYVDRLLKSLATFPPEQVAVLQAGDLLKWVDESYQLAIEKAYKLPSFDNDYQYVDKNGNARKGGYILDSVYFGSNRGVVDKQLQSGGLRLAKILNETFQN